MSLFICEIKKLPQSKRMTAFASHNPPSQPPKEISVDTACEVKIRLVKVHLTWLSLEWHSGPCRFPLGSVSKTLSSKDITKQPATFNLSALTATKIAPVYHPTKIKLSYNPQGRKLPFTSDVFTAMIEKYLTWKKNINNFEILYKDPKMRCFFFNDWAPQKVIVHKATKLLASGTTPPLIFFYQIHAKKIPLFKKKANHQKSIQTAVSRFRKIRKWFWSPIRHSRCSSQL